MGNFSAKSTSLYDFWKKKFPRLVCPCHIRYGTKLVVTDDLGKNGLLVQFFSQRSKIAVLDAHDIHTNFEMIMETT